MFHLTRYIRNPLLLFIFPFSPNNNSYDKVNDVIAKPLDDEMGWDRVKKIFKKDANGELTKEIRSIINMTTSGFTVGLIVGGLSTTKHTVDNFIEKNTEMRFDNHLNAKLQISQKVMENFISKGARIGGKLGFFCFLFGGITTCTTAYRGKLKMENYILGASVTGFLFKINMGIRAALVGAGLAGTLGAICGASSILILTLSGITMDEVIEVQTAWITKNQNTGIQKLKKTKISEEILQVEQIIEKTKKMNDVHETKNVEDSKT